MDFKVLGSILLIVGTSIGAGMLALPIATAQLGFFSSVALLFACWFVMTAGAFLILEVNLWLPQSSNLISMAKATIGPVGQLASWIVYSLLLYSLLCAYIAGGSDLFHNILLAGSVDVPVWTSAMVFTLVLGLIVYLGIRAVDYTNRLLMFIKLSAYFLLVVLLMPYISLDKMSGGDVKYITSSAALTVTLTSFGYSAIVPSLRVYFAGNVKKLKTAIVIGSLIPLLCYIAWDAAIMGIIPLEGEHGLLSVMSSSNSTSDLVNTLSGLVSYGAVTFCAKLFTSICVVTSFLGVALCLADFLADGLQLEKKGVANVIIHLLTFLPPLVIVLFYPNVFVKALEYAGIYCVTLLVLIPAIMAWRGRYHKQMNSAFTVPGGRLLLIVLMVFALITIVRGFT